MDRVIVFCEPGIVVVHIRNCKLGYDFTKGSAQAWDSPLYYADCWRQQGSGAMHKFNATHSVVHFSQTTGWQGTHCIPMFALTVFSIFCA